MGLRITAYLSTDTGSHAPEGPGWYLLVTAADGAKQIVPHARLSATEMEKFGQVIDNFVKDKPKNWARDVERVDSSVRNAIREANEDAQKALQAKIEYLKQQAAQLDILQARADEFKSEEATS